MPPIHLLIKPVSGSCNLRCRYCFYCDEMEKRSTANFGRMSLDTLETVVKNALSTAEESCGFTFQGGEPTLAGLDFYRALLGFQARYNVNGVPITNAIQTNGIGLDREWAEFFARNHFLVGISVDGTKYTHDAYRLTPDGSGSFAAVMDTIALFDQCGVEYNVLTVVNKRTALAVDKVYAFYQKHSWHYLQFIPCLDPLNEVPGEQDYSLTPQLYADFLIRLFELWYRDFCHGRQPYIRLFDSWIGMLLGFAPGACDQRGFCTMQFVTEADGSVYPCDFYVTDAYRLGNWADTSPDEMRRRADALHFDGRSPGIRAEACQGCRYYPLCRGGCARHYVDGKNLFCDSYKQFFDACLPRMEQVANFLASRGIGR